MGFFPNTGNQGVTGNLTVSGSVTTGTLTVGGKALAVPSASVSFGPANPAATASTSLVMMGLGATATYTPTTTGKLLIVIAGAAATAVAAVGLTVGGRFGTGGAPANGAAVTGTRIGGVSDLTMQGTAAATPNPFTLTQVLTGLALGTAIWVDLALLTSNAADAASVVDVMISIAEQVA